VLKEVFSRVSQGYRTADYPRKPPTLPARFRGRPRISTGSCPAGCEQCTDSCPTGAIVSHEGSCRIDLGACLFCGTCADVCPDKRVQFTQEYRMAASHREDLVEHAGNAHQLASALNATAQRLFGRSLRLRQVSAGGCNACEADINVLGTLAFDLGRFGIEMVASPRHADGLMVTGPVPTNMALALKKTWDATPAPKLVIAVGACAISGGPFAAGPGAPEGVGSMLPVDVFIPGCPPHPYTILDGLLRMLGRIEDGFRKP